MYWEIFHISKIFEILHSILLFEKNRMQDKHVVQYKKGTHFYHLLYVKIGSVRKTDYCDMDWYRVRTPQWIRQYWNGERFKSSSPTSMFRFIRQLPHDTMGNWLFIPRNLINQVGNLNTYEWILQDSDNDPMLLKKRRSCESPPDSFTPTIDPACDYNITECCKAKSSQNNCVAKWFEANRAKYSI